ncbi:FKBP-type peptidyl-prolyl cis-trans isomerase [Microcella sp.]|uniref:FKBP-type peptidyl-prolyl cis-trans isomerase n=1 Tax=Microcella sp. TaxID=1913979 RepID=UPI00256D396C|nr:FKBP-type peptidyl-prolyl cis-trans isomerase [Microcella sp.]MBX9471133.1 FKBP-type peptidyl-prolyl cis-trans isomerase [Microcella sp.]
MRRRSALLSSGLSAALLFSLAACAPGEAPTGDGDCAPAGAASDAINVDGAFGSVPTIDFEGPLTAEATQRTVLEQGEGDAVVSGDIALIEYSVFNGETGDELATTGFAGTNAERFPVDTESPQLVGFSLLIECATPGTRLAGVIPPVDGFGEQGVPELGLTGSESLVFVIDVVSIVPPPLERAEGESQEAPEGFPTVELAENGAPTITLPDSEPFTEFDLAVLILGDGPVVEDGQTVTVQYTGMNWNTGEIFDSSWERGAPTDFPTSGVIQGFRDALVGQTVGSQIIAIIPPDLGYGPSGGTPDGSIGPDDVIVFVVDILAAS